MPLPARQIRAPLVAAGEHCVEAGKVRRAGGLERSEHRRVRRPGGRDVVAQRQLEAGEVLEHGGDPRPPRAEVELAHVNAVGLDRARLGVIQAAQQLRERGLARAILPHDGKRRPGGDREIEALEHRRAARVGEREIAEADRSLRHTRGAPGAGGQRSGGAHRRLQAQYGGYRRRSSVEGPVEPAERDHRCAHRALDEHHDLAQIEAAVRHGVGQ